jgi:WD40 repeat protein
MTYWTKSPDGLGKYLTWKIMGIFNPNFGRGHSDWITVVAFSPNGKQIASGYSNGTIKPWDAATGNLQMTLEGHFEVTAVISSRDGKQIASGSIDCNIKLWDAMPDELFKLWDSVEIM